MLMQSWGSVPSADSYWIDLWIGSCLHRFEVCRCVQICCCCCQLCGSRGGRSFHQPQGGCTDRYPLFIHSAASLLKITHNSGQLLSTVDIWSGAQLWERLSGAQKVVNSRLSWTKNVLGCTHTQSGPAEQSDEIGALRVAHVPLSAHPGIDGPIAVDRLFRGLANDLPATLCRVRCS